MHALTCCSCSSRLLQFTEPAYGNSRPHGSFINYWTYWPYTKWMKVQASVKWAWCRITMKTAANWTNNYVRRRHAISSFVSLPKTGNLVSNQPGKKKTTAFFSFKAFIICPGGEMPTAYWFLRNSNIETFGHRLRSKPTNENFKALQHAPIGLAAKLEWRLPRYFQIIYRLLSPDIRNSLVWVAVTTTISL